MRVMKLYLWKEWREQRAGLLGLLVALPLLFGIACVVCKTPALDEVLRPGLAAAAGAVIALLGVGTDLIPGEMRRARVQFLERLPAGLNRAFAAKLVFFASITALVAAYASVIALGLFVWRNGALPDGFLAVTEERSILPAIGVALWMVTISMWVPPGALSFPAVAVAATLLCSPAWFFFGPLSRLEPTTWEVRGFFALCALGSGLSGWASFVRGYRHGASPKRAMRSGATVAVLCLSPAWIWSAHRLYDAHRIDPKDPEFFIMDVRLLEDGRSAVVDACKGDFRSSRSLMVDLHSGAWRPMGEGEGPAASAVSHLPNVPSARDVGLDEHFHLRSWLGLGHCVSQRVDGRWTPIGYFDPFRCKMFRAVDVFPGAELDPRTWVSIRPGRWVVRRAMCRDYEVLDPETLQSAPVDLSRKDHLGPVMRDGRYLLASDGRVFLLDPESGDREPVTIESSSPERIEFIYSAAPNNLPVFAVEPPMVSLSGPNGSALALLDVERRTLSATRSSRSGLMRWAACEDARSVIAVEDNRRLVRLGFGTDEREVLLPREE